MLIIQVMSPDYGSPISHLAIPKRTSLFLFGPSRVEAFGVGEKASDSRLMKVEVVGSFDIFSREPALVSF